MKRLLIALAALLLVLGISPMSAGASGGDDDNSGSGSVSSGSDDEDSDDDSDDRDDDSDDRDDDDSDDRDDDSDHSDDDSDDRDDNSDDHEDDDRHRRRHRNRGGDDAQTGGSGGGASQPPSGPAPNAVTVQVADRAFDPATIRVAVGGTVTWDNVSREHTVTADDSSFDSGVIDQGQRFSKQFAAPATIDYRCLIHPEMTGQVVVGDGPAATGSSEPARRSNSGASLDSRGTATASAAGTGGSSGRPSLGTVAKPMAAAAADAAAVDVADFEFVPADVTIAPGGTVTWTLTGTAPHTVSSDSFDSGMLRPGDTYEQTFNDVGTVDYRCDFHPDMQGTVTVAETSAPRAEPAGGTGGDAGGDGGGAAGADAAPAAATGGTDGATGLLAESGFSGVPALLAALGVILLGWAALVTGRRRRTGPV